MKKLISLLLAVLLLVSTASVLALAEGEEFVVVDGKKDIYYTNDRSIPSNYWNFYSGNTQTTEPVDTERVLNTAYFTWDDDFVYIYFESKYTLEDEMLYQPAEGEERDSRGERYPWYEMASIYLDTAPSIEYNAPCQDPKDPTKPDCNHFHCNANDGEAKYYRLQARTAPAWGDWWNYYRSDEGMFMTYEEFLDWRTNPESKGYDEDYLEDPEGWYAKENGAAEAVSFIDYETKTYGFEIKYPRHEGEEYFQLNICNDANGYEWEEYGPELSYTLSFCEAWWMNADGMVEIWYEDYADYNPDEQPDVVVDPKVNAIRRQMEALPDELTVEDKEAVDKLVYDLSLLNEEQLAQLTEEEIAFIAESAITIEVLLYVKNLGDLNG
ncbi:MAG: hypothetical protein IKM39_04070, partial [Clostridia bacterium]|nr:hypothetical protein [Clostridia bacterium]